MHADLNGRLEEAKARKLECDRLRGILTAAMTERNERRRRLAELSAILEREGRDVERLEGLSLTGLFLSVLGGKETRLEKERQEYLAAKLRHDDCAASAGELDARVEEIEARLGSLGDPEADLEAALAAKERVLRAGAGRAARTLLEIAEARGEALATRREIREARRAGEAAGAALRDALASLGSARSWGRYDLMGGGLIATAVKHGKIDDARRHAGRAQRALSRFRAELADVGAAPDSPLLVEIGRFSTFADYFFDGLIFDWSVQSKINRSRERVEETLRSVARILETLRGREEEVERDLRDLAAARRGIIEEA